MFLGALLQWMKGNVRFESYGNGRLSAWMWWGGVECYLREIKQDPLRHFVLRALKASGNLPHSASKEHRGGVRKRCAGWHYLATGTVCERWEHWLTDWPLCISKCLHLFVPWSAWKNAFILYWAILRVPPCDLCDNGALNMLLGFYFADILFSFHVLSVRNLQASSCLEHCDRCPYSGVMNVSRAEKSTRGHLQEV